LTSSLLVFVRSVDKLNAPSCLFKLLAHSSDTHAYPTRHATRGLFTIPKSRTHYGRCTVLHRAMATWNSIAHQVTDASSRIRFKKQIKIHLMEQWDCEETHTHTQVQTCICTHIHCNMVVLYILYCRCVIMLYDLLFHV
jgi:hypothetical protein